MYIYICALYFFIKHYSEMYAFIKCLNARIMNEYLCRNIINVLVIFFKNKKVPFTIYRRVIKNYIEFHWSITKLFFHKNRYPNNVL